MPRQEPAPSAHRRRRGEGHVTREAILAAARDLFLTEGYSQTTVRRIVERAGVTPPVLYRHFADKEAILFEIADGAFHRLAAAFEAASGGGSPSLARLQRMMEAFLQFGLAHPAEYRVVFMSPDLVPKDVSHVMPPGSGRGEAGSRCFAMLRDEVAALVAAGELVPEDPKVLAEAIWAAGHGLVALLITKPHFPWSDRAALIHTMVAMPIEGLRRR
ncbi:MAG: TetR/AcrR family transcriptional regulator [Geminicoccaceae bacterium]